MDARISSKIGFYIGNPMIKTAKPMQDAWAKKEFSNGIYKTEQGIGFVIVGTNLDEEKYIDEKGRSYNSDNATLGVIPLELLEEQKISENDGHVFKTPGMMYLNSYRGNIIVMLPTGENLLIVGEKRRKRNERRTA